MIQNVNRAVGSTDAKSEDTVLVEMTHFVRGDADSECADNRVQEVEAGRGVGLAKKRLDDLKAELAGIELKGDVNRSPAGREREDSGPQVSKPAGKEASPRHNFSDRRRNLKI